jgi:DNA-binding NtrC family response regulator
MGGGETYDSIKALKLDVKVLLSSGYSIIGEASAILNRGCQGFIQKPFTIKSFSEKLREILDGENTPMYQNLLIH